MNDNTFSEYRPSALPYRHNGNVPPQAPRLREQQAFPQRQAPQPIREQQALPQRPVTPPTRVQQRSTPAKMPKAQALVLLQKMKRGIVIASFLSFGTFSALVMSHTVSTTTQQVAAASITHVATPATTATHTTAATTTSTKKATATTTTPAKKTTPTTTQQGGGYGFGSSTPTSTPVSGTHTS